MGGPLDQPLYQVESELFRTLGHPVLAHRTRGQGRLLAELRVEHAS